MKLEKNIILTDNSVEKMQDLKKGLENITKEEWKICVKSSNKEKSSFLRYIKYFMFSFFIFIKRKQTKNIVSWQQFYGLIYAFYCRIFKVKKTAKLYVCTFIYKDKKIFKNLYYRFIKYIISSIYIDKIICFSDSECEYYAKKFNVDKNKFVYLYLGIEEININKYLLNSDNNYVLTAGKSNRDYDFLIDSIKNTKFDLKIVCNTLKGIENKYNNIKLYDNTFGDDYYSLLANCYCVVIPLKDENISSGQLVILQAMQFKKPVIITKTNTISTYIENNKTGIVIDKNKENLLSSLELIYSDKNYYDKIVNNAYIEFEQNYSLYALGENIAKIMVER